MTSPIRCSAIVMDVEGTTSAARFVYDVLFPYARERMAPWIDEHPDDPTTAAAVAEVAQGLGVSPADTSAVVAQLTAWLDADVKAPPLKALQGMVWAQGYASGELTAHFFADVEPALRAWQAQGILLAVYSSGSVAAQRSLFAHTAHGDLTGLIGANFDLASGGAKREPDSYRRIAAHLGLEPGEVLFLSDIEDELAAARAAGWQAVGVLRRGEQQATASPIGAVSTFAELAVTPSGR